MLSLQSNHEHTLSLSMCHRANQTTHIYNNVRQQSRRQAQCDLRGGVIGETKEVTTCYFSIMILAKRIDERVFTGFCEDRFIP